MYSMATEAQEGVKRVDDDPILRGSGTCVVPAQLVASTQQSIAAPIPCTHLCPDTVKDSCPFVSETTQVTVANDRLLYCRPSVTAANDDSVSLAKSRSYRTALSRTNCPLRVQPEIFRPIRFQTTFSTFSATFGNYSSYFSDRVPSPPVFVSYTHPGHPVLICSSVREIL